MAKIIGLPKLSPTMEEGTLIAWAKAEGDAVEIDDLLAEVETDKATMEFRSFDRGVLLKILVPEGAALAPGAPVAILGKAGEEIGPLLEQLAAQAGPPAAPVAADPGLVPAAVDPGLAPAAVDPPPGPAASDRILASPLVRRLAREQGLELRGVQGSGPRGRIIKRDLEALSAAPAPAAASHAGPAAPYLREPSRIEPASATRRTIARRLVESKQTIPHYYLTMEVDAGPLWDTRKALNADLAASAGKLEPEKISLNDLILKACAGALRREPATNVSWRDGQLHRHQVVDLSIAVAIPDGLVTPVLRDADRLSVLELSRQVRALAESARARKLRPEQMQGGTFSVSNLGMYGIESFSAVINPPEGAILAVGAVREEPVIREGRIVPGRRLRLTLSCDHRAIDGATGASYLATLRRLLEAPALLLMG
ncbi:MAG: 2-oxo acid dehydrogenase subunit E2 [Myxococcales bacterium]|nr:2-oxo acid dehydrogenase subunit E2 [Myxococcales bacterium]